MFEPGGSGDISSSTIALELANETAADHEQLLDLAVGWARIAAAAQARGLAALARLARLPIIDGKAGVVTDDLTSAQLAAAEYAPAVPVSRAAAEAAVDLGLALTRDLPATFAAFRDGAIDLARARAITDEIQSAGPDLGDAERAEIEARVLAWAPHRTSAQVRRDARRALLAVDPAAARRRHEQRVAERSVREQPGPDGTGYLVAHLPTDALALVSTCLDDLADGYRHHCRTTGADPGTHDQRRADALVGVFTAIAQHTALPCDEKGLRWWDPPALPRRHGRRSHLVLTVDACTLAGTSHQPGDLGRHGPIPAAMARRLATTAPTPVSAHPHPLAAGAAVRAEASAGCTVHARTAAGAAMYAGLSAGATGHVHVAAGDAVDARTVSGDAAGAPIECTDPMTGACRHVGTRTPYRPAQHQRDTVIARDRHCRHPHCRRVAMQCDLDHLDPHRDDGTGGPTCPCNLIALCRFHHRLKHRGGWTVTPLDPHLRAAGPLRWTSALGRVYDDSGDPPRPKITRPHRAAGQLVGAGR